MAEKVQFTNSQMLKWMEYVADMIIMAFTLIKYFIYHRGLWEELRGKLPKNIEK